MGFFRVLCFLSTAQPGGGQAACSMDFLRVWVRLSLDFDRSGCRGAKLQLGGLPGALGGGAAVASGLLEVRQLVLER